MTVSHNDNPKCYISHSLYPEMQSSLHLNVIYVFPSKITIQASSETSCEACPLRLTSLYIFVNYSTTVNNLNYVCYHLK